MVDFFRDTFTGAKGESLTTHTPEVGSSYTGAALSTAILDGAGWLPMWPTGTVYSVIATPTAPYALEAQMMFTKQEYADNTTVFEYGLVSLASMAGIKLKVYFKADATVWQYCELTDAAGVVVYSADSAVPSAGIGTYHPFIMRIEVSATGVKFLVDGGVAGTTPLIPDVALALKRVYITTMMGAFSAGSIDYVASSTPPIPSGDFFRDTFTGTGKLSDHLPEIGGKWYQVGQPSEEPLLTGGGECKMWYNGFARAIVNVPNAPYSLEARAVITRADVGKTGPTFNLRLETTYPAVDCLVAMTIGKPNTDMVWTALLRNNSTIVFQRQGLIADLVGLTPPFALGTYFVVRAAVAVNGITWYLNNLQLATTPLLPVSRPNVIYMSTDLGSSGIGFIDYIASSAPPAPIVYFWQDFVRTRETS